MNEFYIPEEKRKKYLSLMHAIQSGVAWQRNFDRSDDDPKHLRVGINAALIETSALVTILIRKGIFTYEEYFDTLISQMEAEVEKYESIANSHHGSDKIRFK